MLGVGFGLLELGFKNLEDLKEMVRGVFVLAGRCLMRLCGSPSSWRLISRTLESSQRQQKLSTSLLNLQDL